MPNATEAAKIITRGYAATPADEKRLRALGVTKPIYLGYKGEVLGKWKMRRGEILGVVRGFRTFGDTRRDWIHAEELVHAEGAVILDLDTGLRSDKNCAKMISYAINPRRPSEEYRAMQVLSVTKRMKSQKRKKTRAHAKIWFNTKLSVKEKVDLIGIPHNALYALYGKTGAPAGRRA